MHQNELLVEAERVFLHFVCPIYFAFFFLQLQNNNLKIFT